MRKSSACTGALLPTSSKPSAHTLTRSLVETRSLSSTRSLPLSSRMHGERQVISIEGYPPAATSTLAEAERRLATQSDTDGPGFVSDNGAPWLSMREGLSVV